jgi:hypothetical protein
MQTTSSHLSVVSVVLVAKAPANDDTSLIWFRLRLQKRQICEQLAKNANNKLYKHVL